MLRAGTKRLGEPGHGKGGSSRTVKTLRALIGLYWPQLEPPPTPLSLGPGALFKVGCTNFPSSHACAWLWSLLTWVNEEFCDLRWLTLAATTAGLPRSLV